jgi:hypothetical protein
MTTVPYVLSIEPVEGAVFHHGFHLGTDLALAKSIAEEKFRNRNRYGLPTRTVALILGHKMVDCFDGQCWSSEQPDCWDDGQ